MAPNYTARYDLLANRLLDPGVAQVPRAERKKKTNTVFGRLQAAAQRLLSIVARYEVRANKDMAKFADQINALCDKWDD